MCFSQYLAILEGLNLFSLVRFENVTSRRSVRCKITRQNATIVHRVGSQNSPQKRDLIPGGGVLPYMGYIGMCGPKGYGFSALLVINRVSIFAL